MHKKLEVKKTLENHKRMLLKAPKCENIGISLTINKMAIVKNSNFVIFKM